MVNPIGLTHFRSSPIESYRRTVLGLPGYGPSQSKIATGNPAVAVTQWNAGWFILDDWFIAKTIFGALRPAAGGSKQHQTTIEPRAARLPVVAAGCTRKKRSQGRDRESFMHRSRPGSHAPLEGWTAPTSARSSSGSRRSFQRFRCCPIRPRGLNPSIRNPAISGRPSRSSLLSAAPVRAAGRARLRHGYLFGRGYHQLRLLDTSAPDAGQYFPARRGTAPILQFASSGRSVQHELMLALRATVGTQDDCVRHTYRLGLTTASTHGPFTIPGIHTIVC